VISPVVGRPAVTRVLLPEDVTEFLLYDATYGQAYAVLNCAVDIFEREQRPITYVEALCAAQVPLPQEGGRP
jgi:hypothetical protein